MPISLSSEARPRPTVGLASLNHGLLIQEEAHPERANPGQRAGLATRGPGGRPGSSPIGARGKETRDGHQKGRTGRTKGRVHTLGQTTHSNPKTETKDIPRVQSVVKLSWIKAAGFQAKAMGANVKIAEAMGETSKTMGNMNKVMDPAKMNKDMQAFAMANERMNMTEETMNDALDDILADSDDEAEQDLVVNQVLDEIGIEISGKMMKAPSVHAGTIGESTTKKKEDQDIEAMLAQLNG